MYPYGPIEWGYWWYRVWVFLFVRDYSWLCWVFCLCVLFFAGLVLPQGHGRGHQMMLARSSSSPVLGQKATRRGRLVPFRARHSPLPLPNLIAPRSMTRTLTHSGISHGRCSRLTATFSIQLSHSSKLLPTLDPATWDWFRPVQTDLVWCGFGFRPKT